MIAIKVRPRNKKEKMLIKTFFKAMNLEIEEVEDSTTSDITNPEILERINRFHTNYKDEDYITVDADNIWKSIL